MRTRRFKALDGPKDKLRIVDKIAVYDDKGNMIDCNIIHKDNDGKEFYYPSNLLSDDKFKLFTDRPKDMIETIRMGYGDGIISPNFLGLYIDKVVRYIDREYGESIRQKTIEGWKDSRFAYGIKLNHLDTFTDGRYLCKDDFIAGFDYKPSDILTFETKEEAKAHIKEIIKLTKSYVKQYDNLERTGDDNYDFENIAKPFFKTIKGRENDDKGFNSIYWRLFCIMKDNRKYSLTVVQVVLTEREDGENGI